MNWRDPKKELPENGQMVWVMLEPHKDRGTLKASSASIEIVCGEAYIAGQKCIVDNYDELGLGSICWVLKDKELVGSQLRGIAWIPLDEMSYPEWRK